jgi:hypothetical protein
VHPWPVVLSHDVIKLLILIINLDEIVLWQKSTGPSRAMAKKQQGHTRFQHFPFYCYWSVAKIKEGAVGWECAGGKKEEKWRGEAAWETKNTKKERREDTRNWNTI